MTTTTIENATETAPDLAHPALAPYVATLPPTTTSPASPTR